MEGVDEEGRESEKGKKGKTKFLKEVKRSLKDMA
tara:strand:- start:387 stop:488 length:102 start_codon:yes stop_codon:yes gene_type:complete